MNVALPHISAPSFMVCDIAAGVVREHDSSPAFMVCDSAAAGALRDVQHDSSNSAAGTYEGGGAQEPKSMIWIQGAWMTRVGRTAFGFSHDLTCKASVVIALHTKGWWDFQIP